MECSLADHSAASQRFVDRHLGSASRAERHQPSSAVAGARWVPHSHRSTLRWIPTRQEVDQVLALRAEGLNGCEIARRTGIPRGTVKGWLTGHAPDFDGPVKAHGP